MTRVRTRRVVSLAVAGLMVTGLLVGAGLAIGNASLGPQKLEEVHGFRSGSEGRIEDDMIALWHAFDRERYVDKCMEQAGFDYSITVAFPHESVLNVARSLGLRGDLGSSSRLMGEGDFLQVMHASVLSDTERDRYYMTLLGESATDVAHFQTTEMLPDGRNDFATGGCRGAAWDEIPGHYVLRDELLREVREAKVSETAGIEPCITDDGLVLDSLAALEAAYEEGSGSGSATHSEVEALLEACEIALLEAEAAAAERARATVFERHKTRLDAHHKEFESVFKKLESDREFILYLDGLILDLEREFDRSHGPEVVEG